MDELSALPPENAYIGITKRSLRMRAVSLNPRHDGHSAASGTMHDPLTIVAPTPLRHLINTTESQRWMSPALSSRGPSPVSAVFPRTPSFSMLYEHGRKGSAVGGGGRRWIRWMHKNGLGRFVVPALIAFATVVKLAMGVGSYSGEATPPMYGDYEAQRHWMEITLHLRVSEWYAYDLEYWGLDYPPLTAYVSWLCGAIGSLVDPTWFALDTSRGIESAGSKLFMRLTVVALDFAVYVPALLLFVSTWQATRSRTTQQQALLTLLLQPALLLVDHGHFQYNSVMLGFTLLAVNWLARGHDVLAALAFVASLGFKQMALYYAPAIGSYLLAKCLYLGPQKGSRLFVRLALTTLLAFAVLFAPFYLPPFASSPTNILQPLKRIFPFDRGLFEDKVANFWCASNVLVKWRRLAGAGAATEEQARAWLVRLSTLLTALGFLPAVVGLLGAGWALRPAAVGADDERAPSAAAAAEESTPFLPLLPYALLTSAMAFFLFSFQVHEKTILVPLLPLTLLASAAAPGSAIHMWSALANNVGVFSMWPLLKRDGQAMAYVATLLLWNRAVGYDPLPIAALVKGRTERTFVRLLSVAVYTACIALHLLELALPPPTRYPDLFAVLNVLISTPVFVLVWLWSIKSGVQVGWAVGGWWTGKSEPGKDGKDGRVKTEELSEKQGQEGRVGGGRPRVESSGSAGGSGSGSGSGSSRKGRSGRGGLPWVGSSAVDPRVVATGRDRRASEGAYPSHVGYKL